MSQEKVNRYKASKINRKEEIKKKKITKAVRTVVACVVLAALVYWLGFSVYKNHEANQPRQVAGADVTELVNYIEGLSNIL